MDKKEGKYHSQSITSKYDYERDCDEIEDVDEDYFNVWKNETKDRKRIVRRGYNKENPY